MQIEPLFKGLTRPALVFGIPIAPFISVFGALILITFWTQQFLILIFLPIAFVIMKIMTKKDDFIFRLFFLKIRFFSPSSMASTKYRKAKTYIPMKNRNQPLNLPKISIYGLASEPSFEKYIPYSSLITDSVIMTKDGMLVTTFQIEGVQFEVEEDDTLTAINNALNMMFLAFSSEPISFYFHNVRHSIQDKLEGKFVNSFLAEIDKKYFDSFSGQKLRKNSLYLSVIFYPFATSLQKTTFFNQDLAKKKIEIKQLISKFSEYINRIQANLTQFGIKQLKTYTKYGNLYSQQLEFYNYLIGGKFIPIRVASMPIYSYLTGGLQNIQFNSNTVQLNYTDETKKFARAIEIKDYTNETFAGILDILFYLDIDYTITQSFSPIPKQKAKATLQKQQRQLIASEDDGVSQTVQITEALDSLSSSNLAFGNYHFNILVFGSSINETKENVNKIITKLNDLGFLATIADIALPAAYFSQFPCNFAIRPRINLLSSKNFSSLIALHNFAKGKREKNCWGEAVTVLKTPNKQPYYLNFHQNSGENKDDFGEFFLANTLILGQSGGGKTVFMNFVINQMLKYADPSTFPADIPEENKKFTEVYLDKDKGALGNILCAGGRYISIKNGQPTGFNPFQVETTQENLRQIKMLMKLCVTRNGEILTTKEERILGDAVDSIMNRFDIEDREYPITLLLENITEDINDNNSLKSRLQAFKKGKQFGWVFDNQVDLLDFPDDINIFGIDGTEFLDDKDVNGIISYYILWKVMNLADGRRLCIDIDEAWKWLENPLVAEEVKNKFKTIRKQNGFLRLATQSVTDFLNLPISKALIEQSATMIFLPNPKAQEEDYVKGLNLTQTEYLTIKDFQPSDRQFLIKRQEEKVICTLDLSSLGVENLKILSTGASYIDTIEKIFAQENKTLDEKINELKEFYRSEK
ncbi:type IV secretion system protein VirB4%2C putative [Campylobacter hyointestinalis subsp. hyointestinalis]|uniref:Type IV secretion system protein VirB4, putative n=2 Tax=Campylobacter TaxID=194 RepID=A0A9W5ARL8_CAMHY|nr:VirB4 family type IV secretion/conjugal transfer ATPase [Campylobacter hyointestinalis]CUU79158.1 type IV secretion system protein VirB4%2C putative [Campylobacter hyointestinalis subsp. hyointestinalis]